MSIDDKIDDDKALIIKEETSIEKKIDESYVEKLQSFGEHLFVGGVTGVVGGFLIINGGLCYNLSRYLKILNKIDNQIPTTKNQIAFNVGYSTTLIAYGYYEALIALSLLTPLVGVNAAFSLYLAQKIITNICGFIYYEQKEQQCLKSAKNKLLEQNNETLKWQT